MCGQRKGSTEKGQNYQWSVQRFKERNPTVCLRKGDSMASVRFQCTSSEIIDEYYDLPDNVLTEFDLHHKSGQIYNVDETGMSLDLRNSRFVLQKARRKFNSMAVVTYQTSLYSQFL